MVNQAAVASAGILVFVLVASNSANAQSSDGARAAVSDAPAGGLEEVRVTAQRRTENLQDVPISVTVFSGTELATQQITSTLDLGRVVPDFFSSNNVGQGSANAFFIRGLGQSQSFPTFEPQVGVYVEDIYISRVNANNLALFGVDQLQVLNGPQGTLFGRNSAAGAIVVSLQKPGSEFGGHFDLSYGSFNEVRGQMAVDLPINPEILTRTSFYGINNDGYVEDLTTHQTLNAVHNFGVREAVVVVPANSTFRWDVSVDYERNDSANLLNQPSSFGGANGSDRISYSGFSTTGGALLPYLTGRKAGLGQGALVTTYGLASNIRLNFDAGTLNFITGYRGLAQNLAGDFQLAGFGPLSDGADAIPTGELALAQEVRNNEYTQELKWTATSDLVNYTGGLYYLYEVSGDDYGQVLGLSPQQALTLNDQFARNTTASASGYLQGDLKFTPKLTLTLGGRYTREIKTVDLHPDQAALGFTTAQVQAAGYLTRLVANEFTPRIALQYKYDERSLLFLSATRGFQGGGWNGLTGANPVDYNNFGPQSLWSYEAGFRFETADRRLRLNATVFYQDVKHDQLLYDNPNDAMPTFDTNNAANMWAYGVEVSTDWRPIENLTLRGNLSSMNAGYYDPSELILEQIANCLGGVSATCNSGIVRANGTLAKPVFAPSLAFTLTGSYILAFDSFSLTPTASVHFVGDEWFDTANAEPVAAASPAPAGGHDKPRTLLDLGVTYAPRSLPLTVTAECKNCTMQNYGTANLLGVNYFNYPGTWDLAFRYRF